MSQLHGRILGSAAAFAFADVWVVAGFTAAVGCALAAALGYGAVVAIQRQALASIRSGITRRRRPLRSAVAAKPARRPRAVMTDVPTAETTYGW
ncbi:MAG TPA: hypothetical protein VE982_01845 [Gaiellaceae bacterium]|nr:hypothetical protein [Gaiellaceae bacterium]